MKGGDITSRNFFDKEKSRAPPILLEKAAFLLHLGLARAALVLYDWACEYAPTDPEALEGRTLAWQGAIDQETARYWRKIMLRGDTYSTACRYNRDPS